MGQVIKSKNIKEPKQTIKVMQVCAFALQRGGVAANVINGIRLSNLSKVRTDITVFDKAEGYYDKEVEKQGKIFRILLNPAKSRIQTYLHLIIDYYQIKRSFVKILKENGPYDTVHCQNMFQAAPCLAAAKKVGVPVRIAHSHGNYVPNLRKYRRLNNQIMRCILKRTATIKLGVTRGALEYLFGDQTGAVIENMSIDFSLFDPKRYLEKSENDIALIHIGVFNDNKNQSFSFSVFEELRKKHENVRLVFIGYNADQKKDAIGEIRDKAEKTGNKNSVVFLPMDSDIAKEIAGTDFMLVPSSKSEGLPTVALEAQAMNVPCFLSDIITKETDCGLCTFLPLSAGPEAWADAILSYRKQYGHKKKRKADISRYDNKVVYQKYYSIWTGKKEENQ